MSPAATPSSDLSFKPTYGQFRKAITGQETGDRYGLVNPASGALGVGQQMPDTARVLAQRMGLPYRPDLLKGTTPEAQRYQDQITNAAVREAWEAGGAGSDVRTSAHYYFGGSDRGKWGPKTRRYGNDILSRLQALRGY